MTMRRSSQSRSVSYITLWLSLAVFAAFSATAAASPWETRIVDAEGNVGFYLRYLGRLAPGMWRAQATDLVSTRELVSFALPTALAGTLGLVAMSIDLLLVGSLVRHGLETQGRFAALSVVLPDEPGQLAAVLTTVADLGANLLSTDHHREGRGLPYGMVEVRLSIETKSKNHREAVVNALRDQGLEVSL